MLPMRWLALLVLVAPPEKQCLVGASATSSKKERGLPSRHHATKRERQQGGLRLHLPPALQLGDYEPTIAADSGQLATEFFKMQSQQGRRNHDCIVVDSRLFIVLGRHAESVESVEFLTAPRPPFLVLRQRNFSAAPPTVKKMGKKKKKMSWLYNLNHVSLAKSRDDNTVFLPCGFEGHAVGRETSTNKTRFLNLASLELSEGPQLPRGVGGACATLNLDVAGRESVCTFGGTIGGHDDGDLSAAVRCMDVQRKEWIKETPLPKLPYGLDHGSAVHIEKNACGPDDDPGDRLLVLNYRTEHYAGMRTEILALSLEKPLKEWYVLANDTTSMPRDAAGDIILDRGRYIVQFGGVAYAYGANESEAAEAGVAANLALLSDEPRTARISGAVESKERGWHVTISFAEIRAMDTCAPEPKWVQIGLMTEPRFATKTCHNEDFVFTCGGFAHTPNYNSGRCDSQRTDHLTGVLATTLRNKTHTDKERRRRLQRDDNMRRLIDTYGYKRQ